MSLSLDLHNLIIGCLIIALAVCCLDSRMHLDSECEIRSHKLVSVAVRAGTSLVSIFLRWVFS